MDTLELAKDKALYAIARRRLTKKELSDKLERYGFEPDILNEVILWAIEYGFVNDDEYARCFISDAINIKHWGRRRIVQALSFKGIDSITLENALSEFDFSSEAENICEEVKRRLNGNYERKNVDRVIRHYIGRGYSYSDIKKAIGTCMEEEDFEV